MRFEIESFTIESGFELKTTGWASGGELLRTSFSEDGEARASMIFDGASGLYDLTLGYADENDGEARIAIFVDGVAVDAFVWDEDRGESAARAGAFTSRLVASVQIETGARIEIRGFRDAGERLETDYLDIVAAVGGPSATAPQNLVPLTRSTLINTSFVFTGSDAVSVSDPDGGRLTTTLQATNGSLAVGTTTAAVIITDDGATTTLSGTEAELNAALSGLTFTPDRDYLGAATLSIFTTDGAQTDVDVIDLSVDPFGDPDAIISATSGDPGFFENRLHFNYIDFPDVNSPVSRGFKSTAELRVANEGTVPLEISGFEIDGPFQLTNPAQLANVTLAPGESISVEVAFDRASHTPTPNGVNGVFSGALRIYSNDLNANVTTIDLAGHWQDRDEGGFEANINEIWEVFGFGNRIEDLPFRDPMTPFDTGGLFAALDENEVLSPYWRIADGFDEARITMIGRYSGPGEEIIRIHRPYSKSQAAVEIANLDVDTQTILPRAAPGSAIVGPGAVADPVFTSITFTNETIPDFWQGDEAFGILARNFSTDPSLNTFGEGPADPDPTEVYGHWMRMFRALDAHGNVIPNVYLGLQDLLGLNFDYNDHFLLLVGLEPVSQAPINTLPSSVVTVEDTPFAFTGPDLISVSDADAPALTREMKSFIQVENGTVTVTAAPNVTISGNGTNFLTIVAERVTDGGPDSVTRLNDTLATLVYTPNLDFDGTDVLRVTTNDRALRDVDEIAIVVTPVDDGPPPFRVEAEDFALVQGFEVASRAIASGGEIIETASNAEAVAQFVFSGADGVYDLALGYYDENDGAASMRLLVNGIALDDWLWDQDLGDSGLSPQTLTERQIADVALSDGDVIELRGFRDGGSEKLRTDYLDFLFVDDLVA